ncbi:CGNR zinc finger domain-containing protein [Actinoalloteichus hymeniacidonis]|uniref:Conserved protein containing a Zn-ribbon-like motif n=1 Tax=Actinoalloteichus hymeniacidonis TaxID=340345 RepID=A0AAC9HUI2_9PSEU|nr:ABATE domain-containing protein [Actinoalloteichus hymeniacidonis]AOS64760.1 conserved protein containing a Zn-ribbon-like motif [Actinoalloteichus hymeniacidonis]MBB5907164.1 putative RNA-binding Zn ribbon-like protein [Actinoalloteichus hymeniacidonis]
MTGRQLAMQLAGTIRHDGAGGVADDLADPAGLTAWLADHAELLPEVAGPGRIPADEQTRSAVVAVRSATRALFARTVPGRPSRADEHRLPPIADAVAILNAASAADPVAPALNWSSGSAPAVELHSASNDPLTRLLATLARAAFDFLTGPDRDRLRACTAPRCVRYFLQGHGRQEFCKPACSNRARAARHYDRRHPERSNLSLG